MPTAACHARAAIAGNPSDGYGGAVVATPVTSVAATVAVDPADRFEVCPSPTPDDTFGSLGELAARVDLVGYIGARGLVLATLRALARRGIELPPVRISVTTTIPHSVGLAGSSAIVIAAIRALATLDGVDEGLAGIVGTPERLAAVALAAEADELGIPAGPQDRLVQAHETPLAMDFGGAEPVCRPLELVGDVFVAALPASAQSSATPHRALRESWEEREDVRRTMDEIAEQAHHASRAIEHGDVASLGAAMDATLAARRRMMVLDPRLLAVADAVQSLGCHANWAGSGGAVTVLAPNAILAEVARRTLADDHGALLLEL